MITIEVLLYIATAATATYTTIIGIVIGKKLRYIRQWVMIATGSFLFAVTRINLLYTQFYPQNIVLLNLSLLTVAFALIAIGFTDFYQHLKTIGRTKKQ